METRSNYAIVGAVVVALTIAMFAGVIWLARFAGADDQHFDIFFKQSINGLAIGSPVAFNGVPVGKIEQIKLLPETPQFVRVRITIAEDVPVLKGTTAAVEGVGFTGVSQIQLSGAMQGAERITEKGPYGVPVIPPRVGGFGALLANAPELLNNVSKLTERLGELLNPENRNSIGNILKNTDKATGALAERARTQDAHYDADPQVGRPRGRSGQQPLAQEQREHAEEEKEGQLDEQRGEHVHAHLLEKDS
jgi:phospholipid/cholesterol/gamma-HCH transport system substrate-binding protein